MIFVLMLKMGGIYMGMSGKDDKAVCPVMLYMQVVMGKRLGGGRELNS